MKTYARIDNGIAVELIETDGDILTMFHPSITWVECDAAVGLGWKYTDGEFSPPVATPAPALADLQTAALALLPVWEEAERASGIEFNGHRWLTTPAAVQDITGALLRGVLRRGGWLAEDRIPVPMTFQDLQELWNAMFDRGEEIYDRRLQMEAEIADMDAEQLAVFEPGW